MKFRGHLRRRGASHWGRALAISISTEAVCLASAESMIRNGKAIGNTAREAQLCIKVLASEHTKQSTERTQQAVERRRQAAASAAEGRRRQAGISRVTCCLLLNIARTF
jgi:hypothetical protein